MVNGDSIRVMHEGKAERIRLIGVDCPEKRQPFGTKAKVYTSDLAFGQDVTVYGDRRDRYGRTLGEVLLPRWSQLESGTYQGWPGGSESIRETRSSETLRTKPEGKRRDYGPIRTRSLHWNGGGKMAFPDLIC